MSARKILQIDPSDQSVIAEHASAKAAALAVDKPNGQANIMLCCGHNHMVDGTAHRAYGFFWRFSE